MLTSSFLIPFLLGLGLDQLLLSSIEPVNGAPSDTFRTLFLTSANFEEHKRTCCKISRENASSKLEQCGSILRKEPFHKILCEDKHKVYSPPPEPNPAPWQYLVSFILGATVSLAAGAMIYACFEVKLTRRRKRPKDKAGPYSSQPSCSS